MNFKPSAEACLKKHCRFLEGEEIETATGPKRRLICTYNSLNRIPGNFYECPMNSKLHFVPSISACRKRSCGNLIKTRYEGRYRWVCGACNQIPANMGECPLDLGDESRG